MQTDTCEEERYQEFRDTLREIPLARSGALGKGKTGKKCTDDRGYARRYGQNGEGKKKAQSENETRLGSPQGALYMRRHVAHGVSSPARNDDSKGTR